MLGGGLFAEGRGTQAGENSFWLKSDGHLEDAHPGWAKEQNIECTDRVFDLNACFLSSLS